ncbi:MAG: Xaa-Pro peptidase family protein [candidate division WOR-3 bacterium]|nr:Xaa-Pro peptidase family protein [candidate division WOR-3 bacterium]
MNQFRPSKEPYKSRLMQVKHYLTQHKLDAFLITDLSNLFYLVNYTGSNGMLLIKKNQALPIFYTDFRYQTQVYNEVYNCQIKIVNRNLFTQFPTEDLDPISICGFESNHLTYANYQKLKLQLKNKVKLIPRDDGFIEELRSIKSNLELEKIKKAVAITDKVYRNILTKIRPNVTEKDLANEIDYQLKKEADIAFPTIVAFAERSALPHAQPTNRKLKKGDVILFDFGARYDYYCADMTRTIVLGKATAEIKKLYDIVSSAQKKAQAKIKSDVCCADIDKTAREWIQNQGYGEYFGHGLGHGVGIMVHEKPMLTTKSTDKLKTGQTITIEPGIYLPQKYGIRIEDLVLVKKDCGEILTLSPKELIEI